MSITSDFLEKMINWNDNNIAYRYYYCNLFFRFCRSSLSGPNRPLNSIIYHRTVSFRSRTKIKPWSEIVALFDDFLLLYYQILHRTIRIFSALLAQTRESYLYSYGAKPRNFRVYMIYVL